MPPVRISKACDACSKRKLKCDGKTPCVQCTAAEWDCTYTPTNRKRGPPKGYRKHLEYTQDRLKSVDEILSDLSSVSNMDSYVRGQLQSLRQVLQLPSTSQQAQPSSSPSRRMISIAPMKTESHQRQNLDIRHATATRHNGDTMYPRRSSRTDDIVANHQAVGGTQYWGASSGMYMLPPIRTIAAPYQPSSSPRPMIASTEPVFSDEINQHLMQTFFAYIHPLYPFIYKPSLGSLNFASKAAVQAIIPPILLFAMHASAARFSDHPLVFPGAEIEGKVTGETIAGDTFYEHTRYLLWADNLAPRISTVQALLFCCHREIACGRGSEGWMYGGMALRMAVDLGLHRNDEVIPNLSFAERQMRRRTFWGCYVIDRVTAAFLGRPITIRDEDTDAQLPSESESDEFDLWYDWSGTPSDVSSAMQTAKKTRCITNFIHYISLARILGLILCKIYPQQCDPRSSYTDEIVQELEGQLAEWYRGLPLCVRDADLPHHNTVMMWHQLCIIILHRSFISQRIGATTSWRPTPQESASLDKCRKAADRLEEMVTHYNRIYGLRKCSSMAMFGLFAAAAIFLADATTNLEANAKFDRCLSYLADLSTSWPLAGHLYRLAKNHRDAVVEKGETRPPSPIPATTALTSEVQPYALDDTLFGDELANITWGDLQMLFPLTMTMDGGTGVGGPTW